MCYNNLTDILLDWESGRGGLSLTVAGHKVVFAAILGGCRKCGYILIFSPNIVSSRESMFFCLVKLIIMGGRVRLFLVYF